MGRGRRVDLGGTGAARRIAAGSMSGDVAGCCTETTGTTARTAGTRPRSGRVRRIRKDSNLRPSVP